MKNMLEITHLRHVSLITPKLDEQIQFYEDIWGLDKISEDENNAYFRGAGPEHHILHLTRGNRRGIHHIAFGMVDKIAVDQAAEYLKEKGVDVIQEPGYLDEKGSGYGLRFVDFENRCYELSTWTEIHVEPWNQKQDANPLFLNHVVLNTTDIYRMTDFFTEVLGFKVSDWSEDKMVFLRCNKNHHSISFHQKEHAALNHIAYEVSGVDEVMRGISNIRREGHQEIWGPGRHGPGNNIFCYFQDIAGFVIEYTSDLTVIDDEKTYQSRVWKRVPRLMDRWGTAGPAPDAARTAMAGTPDPGWANQITQL